MSRELSVTFTIDDVTALRVVGFEATHEAGRPFVLEVDAVFGAYSEIENVVGKPAQVDLRGSGPEPRAFFGIVERARVIGSARLGIATRGTRYQLRVVSRFGLLAGWVTSRIFQELSLIHI